MVCVSIYQCFNKNVIASNNWASKVTVYVHVHGTSLIYNSDKSLYNNYLTENYQGVYTNNQY